jgi:hypothetical protein
LWKPAEKLSEDDNADLAKQFREDEVKHAPFSMEANKASGPDNIPVEFTLLGSG